jgi:hypothetical protein
MKIAYVLKPSQDIGDIRGTTKSNGGIQPGSEHEKVRDFAGGRQSAASGPMVTIRGVSVIWRGVARASVMKVRS